MKKLILVRHGETAKNKSDSARGLTPNGIMQVKELAEKIRADIVNPAMILHSPEMRARETAQILANKLRIKNVMSNELRILHAGRIKSLIDTNRRKGIRSAKTYLHLTQHQEYGVESPDELSRRWLTMLKDQDADTLLVVSHEASLEAFHIYQTEFQVLRKSYDLYFDYADFAILTPHNI